MSKISEADSTERTKTVLIVDEDKRLVELLKKRCQAIGLDVVAAHDSMTAVGIMDNGLPDLMIVDINMSTRDHKTFLEILDWWEDADQIRAIVLFELNDPSSIQRCRSIWAYYVHKSPQAWNQIKMFVYELVDLDPNSFDGTFQSKKHEF